MCGSSITHHARFSRRPNGPVSVIKALQRSQAGRGHESLINCFANGWTQPWISTWAPYGMRSPRKRKLRSLERSREVIRLRSTLTRGLQLARNFNSNDRCAGCASSKTLLPPYITIGTFLLLALLVRWKAQGVVVREAFDAKFAILHRTCRSSSLGSELTGDAMESLQPVLRVGSGFSAIRFSSWLCPLSVD